MPRQADTLFEDQFSHDVWETTYKDHEDTCLDDTFRRVAKFVASAEETDELREEWEENFYQLLSGFNATAGGRIYSNAGTEWGGTTLMNCFVGPREDYDCDSLGGIFEHLQAQSMTLKSEGGWGENFSYIRPRGSFIHGIGVETPGAVKYMESFDKMSEIITSGSGKERTHAKAKGKIRKGAMMGVLDVWHPDILEFITAKQTPGRLSKFNVSVNCSDEFMAKVNEVRAMREAGADEDAIYETDTWELRFPETTHERYKEEWDGHLLNWEAKGYPVKVFKTVSATWLWNLIMESTYNRAEPGVLFLDRANYFNPLAYAETIQATNPCGEQTLAPGGVCNLGSLNLTQFVNAGRTGFDLGRLADNAKLLVRFLDNINAVSKAPLPIYEDSMKKKRRIGCGILGWGSALFMLKVRFGSDRAHELREEVMSTIAKAAYEASIVLAAEKGAFEYCDNARHAEGPFIKSLGLHDVYMDQLRETGIRNSSVLSVQPTGNTSIFANVVSGGLEPVFMPEYVRTVIVNTMPSHIAHCTPKWYEGEMHETEMFKWTKEGEEDILRGEDENGTVYKIDSNRGLTREVLCEDYGVRFLKRLGEWDPDADWAVTTTNLSVGDHTADLIGFARWVDSAMSKTVNVPNDYPFEEFQNIYLDSYNSGYVKGVTTYRSGTMMAVLSMKEEKEADSGFEEEVVLDDVKLPDSAPATLKTIRAEGRKWYVTVVTHEDSDRPWSIFVKTNDVEKTVVADAACDALLALARKKGIPEHHCEKVENKIKHEKNSSKIARLIGFNLRHGVLIKNIVAVLDGVEEAYVGTFVFAIKKFLGQYIKDGEKVEDEKCMECGSDNVVFQEGCKLCRSCGSSRCG